MNILIAGYYGFGNLGDELILSTILSQINERHPHSSITVLSASPEDTASLHGIPSLSRWNPLTVLRALWKCDLLILGGGGLIQNKTSNRSLVYYLGLVGIARLFQCSVLLYALGVEAVEETMWGMAIKAALSGKKVKITVRDVGSKEKLLNMGIPPASIHVTADPVFCRPVEEVPHERYAATASLKALLIPRFPAPAGGEVVFETLHRILAAEKGAQVKGVLFQPGEEARFAQRFAAKLVPPLDYIPSLSLHSSSSQVGSFDFVVSARFHGLVLSAMSSRPFIGIGDPDKIKRLCEALNMPYLPWNADEKEIRAAIETLVSSPLSGGDAAVIENWRKAASKTVDYIPSL